MSGIVIQGSFPHGLPRALQAMHTPAPASWVQQAIGRLSPARPDAAANASAVALPPNFSFRGGNGQPLPAAVRQNMEALFGTSFTDIRIHVGPHAAAIGAIAFTQGTSIHFSPGHYNPDSPAGRRVLAHELTHVVQQRSGRVRNPFGSGVAVVHDRTLEADAERMSVRAALQPRTVRFPIQRASSSLADTTASESGQIYGIWENEEYPNKIQKSSLGSKKCLYVGKTARGQNLGSRWVEHCTLDFSAPWCGLDYSDPDDDKWPYVPRNLWLFNGVTKLDVAVAEQFYMQEMLTAGAQLHNRRNEITPVKFKEVKGSGAWTTSGDYKGWKPVDVFTI